MSDGAVALSSHSRTSTRTPVSFTNRNGLRLFGVIHEPVPPPRPGTPAVIMLSPGVKMRVGPQRLYLRLTELFLSLSVPVLRFDCHGLGDSEGVLPEDQLRDVYGQIEVGRFIDDTVDAMNWMQKERGVNRFILSGLCGGAITGLLAGARDSRMVGLLALGMTPLLASKSADPSRYMTSGQLEDIGRSYFVKLLRPDAWLRLLTFRSDYRLLVRAVLQAVHGTPKTPTAGPAAPPPADDNASPLFPPAFFQMLETRRPMLFIFGGSDRLAWEFEEKFVSRYRTRLAAHADGYHVHTIPLANHVISLATWQDEMVDVAGRWFQQQFGTPPAS